MQRYTVNFFIWWYWVKGVQIYNWIIKRLNFTLEITNTRVMLANLTEPMFQDNSGVGRAIGFFLRLMWVWVGGILTGFTAVPLFGLLILYWLIPPLVIVRIVLIVIGLVI